jgi:peptide-methionine (S)-S-oxide reductase
MALFGHPKLRIPTAEEALPGRSQTMPVAPAHTVLGTSMTGPWAEGVAVAYFGLGCFWGAERCFWQLPGVVTTAVGYQGGHTPNPTYQEVCSGFTGHAETVLVAYDPARITFEQLLACFWESHDPTQGMRQGNDIGTQYRSTIYTTTPAQLEAARRSAEVFGARLAEHRLGPVTTEIREAPVFYYAEDYHQQYLDKVPNGYCGLGGTGVSCPVGLLTS